VRPRVTPFCRWCSLRQARPCPPLALVAAPFGVRTEPLSDDQVLVAVTGEVDIAVADLLLDALTSIVEPGLTSTVDVDLSETTFIDAMGISALLVAREVAVARGTGMRIRGADGIVRTVLEVVGLLGVLGGKPDPGDGAPP
jgi:anti-sigma B factor antagonist